jgi:3-deoxy-D-manno-octulosonic-acid transferase
MWAYLLARRALQPFMPMVLRRRLRQGKEDPARMGEKLGQPTQARPAGPLIWVHAVGLGEVLALRPLIDAFRMERPGVSVLLTSTARSSAQVIGANLPPGALHQMLPLDGPRFMRAFLDHWRPDLSIWSEQDLWPGAVHDTAARGIPLAYVNARMNAASYAKRARIAGIYRATLARFSRVYAQDPGSADHLRRLGAPEVRLMRSLKPAAQPLQADPKELARLQGILAGRKVWVAASTHAADEAVVLAAHAKLQAQDPTWLLVLVPRVPARAGEIAPALTAAGLGFAQRSLGQAPQAQTAVLLADTFGELGLWYRLAQSAFVGGSFGGLGGHNPWEAVCLGLPVLSGPDTANFHADYADLAALGVARVLPVVDPAEALAKAVLRSKEGGQLDAVHMLINTAREEVALLARDLLSLMKVPP